MGTFSIIICTYNPTQELFQEVIESVSKLIIPEGHGVECCIVDNNSTTPVNDLPYVKSFTTRYSWARVINETKQGQTAARIAGVKATTNPIIVFFDDDNRPDKNYLVHLVSLLNEYPQVGAWGPGRVAVQFTEQVSDWVQSRKFLFQERNNETIAFGNEQHWTSYYPPGTGQVVKREVLEQYIQHAESGLSRITGRKGNSLVCGEDAQIVYTAVKNGYSAGISPGLIVEHLIPRKRTEIGYIKRLQYNIMATGAIANVEIFPNQKEFYYENIRSKSAIITSLIRIIGSNLLSRSADTFQMHSAMYLGKLAGSYEVVSGRVPLWLTLLAKVLKLN
jgi:glycosyltransferase involved in cell wall biosynthesis